MDPVNARKDPATVTAIASTNLFSICCVITSSTSMWYILTGIIVGGIVGAVVEKRVTAAESKAAAERLAALRKEVEGKQEAA